jgi:hypothetical protein
MTPRLAPVLFVLCLGPGLLGGCTYYQIHDPHSGKTYYTTNWESMGVESGVIVFKDAASRAKVTLANHEITKIKERQYKASVNRQLAE